MRHHHDLTPFTIKVVNGKAQAIAEEADVTDKYIYGILAGTQTDWFAVFAFYFAACVRAGCDVSPWLTELDRIQMKYTFSDPLCVRKTAADLEKESSEATIATLTDEPLYVQLRERTEAVTAAQKAVDAVLAAINAEKAAEGQPNTRVNGNVRNHVANLEAVKQRRAS